MSAEDLRDRCRVERWDPPVYGIDERLWTAEDPETGCLGLGRVEAEAVGNLLAVVEEYRDDGATGAPYVKVPGDTLPRTWARDGDDGDDGGGALGRLRDGLGL